MGEYFTKERADWQAQDAESNPAVKEGTPDNSHGAERDENPIDSSQEVDNPVERPAIKREKTNTTILERFRHWRMRDTFITIMVNLSVSAATVGKELLGEQRVLKKSEAIVEERHRELESVRQEVAQLTRLFGDNPGILKDYYAIETLEQGSSVVRAVKAVSGLDVKRNQAKERLTGRTSQVEEKKTSAASTVDVGELQAKQEGRDIVLTEGAIRKVLGVLPKTWVEGEITRINTDGKIVDLPESYGIKGAKEAANAFTGLDGTTEITFHQADEGVDSRWVLSDGLPHEIAHANDWDNDANLDFKRRLDLLQSVAERVQSSDRYLSSYVEGISNKDSQLELYQKAKEYWAEISTAYFTDPDRLADADYLIVDDAIMDAEPDYNPDGVEKRIVDVIKEVIRTNE